MTRFLIATCVAAVLLVLATSSGAQPVPEGAPSAPVDPAPVDPAAPAEVATAPAVAAPVVVPEEPGEVVGIMGKIMQAARDGNWSLVFVLAIMVLVWGARALAGKWEALKPLTTRWGGWGLVLAGTSAAAVATALLSGEGISWALLSSAITYGLAAAAAHELHGDSGLK